MKLIVGLGNPGEKHKGSRHNVGFLVLDVIASRVGSGKWMVDRKNHNTLYTKHQSLVLAKPQTFMNNSGQAVWKLVTHYKVKMPNLWVIHDDLDIKLGDYKIQKGKGPKEHKGLLSIYKSLGINDFWHVRIGIDNREERSKKYEVGERISGEDYVLGDFTKKELAIVNKVIEKIIDELVSSRFANSI